MEAESKTITIATYDLTGERLSVGQIEHDKLDSESLAYFSKKLSRLSGDLELPLEGKLPGEIPFLDFRIGSDLNGAYVLYYLHDEVVFASLYLRGQDETNESELAQVFKFLLLDQDDADEPTEEEIESLLSADAFLFDDMTERPIVHAVQFGHEPDEEAEFAHIQRMDQHVAAVFMNLPSK